MAYDYDGLTMKVLLDQPGYLSVIIGECVCGQHFRVTSHSVPTGEIALRTKYRNHAQPESAELCVYGLNGSRWTVGRGGVLQHVRRVAVQLAVLVVLMTGLAAVPAIEAHAATVTTGDRLLNWAEYHATGHWYGWGGTGPSVYDCSGLVYAAAQANGISLPRTTYGMLAGSAHLYQISLSQVRRGDLLFYGSGHVEFATIWWHQSFGAQTTGTRVGWHTWNSYWAPTMAMRIR